jgi:undecaprenyl-diphosphatase
VFADLTEDMFASGEDPTPFLQLDRAILLAVARMREAALTHVAVDLTALGSPSVLGVFTFVAVLMLLVARDRRGVVQLLVSSMGAAALTPWVKHGVGRPRPDVVSQLVVVHGASYPSGHALGAAAVYLGAALVAGRHWAHPRGRLVTLALAVALSITIAGSRVYLGVHYPTDACAGVSLGYAWATSVALGVRWVSASWETWRRKSRSDEPRA